MKTKKKRLTALHAAAVPKAVKLPDAARLEDVRSEAAGCTTARLVARMRMLARQVGRQQLAGGECLAAVNILTTGGLVSLVGERLRIIFGGMMEIELLIVCLKEDHQVLLLSIMRLLSSLGYLL